MTEKFENTQSGDISTTFEEEVFSFETEYGEISDEKVISVDSLKDLGLDEKFLALIKVEKKSDIFIACSVI